MPILIHVWILLHKSYRTFQNHSKKNCSSIPSNFHRLVKNFYSLKHLLSWITPAWLSTTNKMLSGTHRKAAKSALGGGWNPVILTLFLLIRNEFSRKSSPQGYKGWGCSPRRIQGMVKTKKRARISCLQVEGKVYRGRALSSFFHSPTSPSPENNTTING